MHSYTLWYFKCSLCNYSTTLKHKLTKYITMVIAQLNQLNTWCRISNTTLVFDHKARYFEGVWLWYIHSAYVCVYQLWITLANPIFPFLYFQIRVIMAWRLWPVDANIKLSSQGFHMTMASLTTGELWDSEGHWVSRYGLVRSVPV